MACRQGLIPAISVRLVLESKGPWHRNGGSLAIRDLYQVPCSGAPSCHFHSGHTHTCHPFLCNLCPEQKLTLPAVF